MDVGIPELLIILLIVILLFGVGRVVTIGRDLGTAIREFRKGLQSEETPPREEGKKKP